MRKITKFSQLKKGKYYFYKSKNDSKILIFNIIKTYHNHQSIRDRILLEGIDNNWNLASDNFEDTFGEEEFNDYLLEWNIFELNSKEIEKYKQKIMLLKL